MVALPVLVSPCETVLYSRSHKKSHWLQPTEGRPASLPAHLPSFPPPPPHMDSRLPPGSPPPPARTPSKPSALLGASHGSPQRGLGPDTAPLCESFQASNSQASPSVERMKNRRWDWGRPGNPGPQQRQAPSFSAGVGPVPSPLRQCWGPRGVGEQAGTSALSFVAGCCSPRPTGAVGTARGHHLHLAGGGHEGPHPHTRGSGTEQGGARRSESTGLAAGSCSLSPNLFCHLSSWEKFGFTGDEQESRRKGLRCPPMLTQVQFGRGASQYS